MIFKLQEFFIRGFKVARAHEQFFFTLALLVIVPLAFLWSGQQFLQVAREHAEQAERARIGLLHDSLSVLYSETGDTSILRRTVADVARLNPDLVHLSVIRYIDNEPDIDILIGEAANEKLYDELVRKALGGWDESIIYDIPGPIRHWVGVRELSNEMNGPRAFIVTDVSMERSDAYFSAQVRKTYLYLGGILLLLMLLIARHARIINYVALYRESTKALEAKTTFINMTAHELRAPLSALRGYGSMIREDGSAAPKIREYASRIEESAGYLVSLVNDLLAVAKMQSGTLAMGKEVIVVRDAITRIVERLEPLAKEHKIMLLFETKDVASRIKVDETRFEEILTNLVSNAIKYTKEGRVALSLAEERGNCVIRIKDTGIGMRAEDQQKLFSPYFRSSEVEGSSMTGTGLGLWITKQFIEAMNGKVSVESIHGVGTHIIVMFPLV